MKQSIAVLALLMLATLVSFHNAKAADQDAAQGRKYFMQYCASCHGVDGTGNGPVAAELSKPPANLRLLGEKYGMPLPGYKLAQIIDGRDTIRAHGTRDMPVWGEKLYAAGEAPRGELSIGETIGKIIAYLNTIQSHRTALEENDFILPTASAL